MTQMAPYRHTEIVRVEECASCEQRAARALARKKVAEERLIPAGKFLGVGAPWAFMLGTLAHLVASPWLSIPLGVLSAFAAVGALVMAVAAVTGELQLLLGDE